MSQGIAAYAVIIIASILTLGIFAYFRHERTHKQLTRIQKDLNGGMQSIHDRADREIAERAWSIQGIRAAIEMVRVQIAALFRKGP